MTAQTNAMTAGVVDRRWDDMQFRIVFALSLPVFFIGALAMRVIAKPSSDTPQRSIFAQAWEASGTTAQIAFSG